MDVAVRQLLTGIALRQRLERFGRRFRVAFLVLAGVFLVALVALRFCGLAPEVVRWWQVLLVPVLAVPVALLPWPRLDLRRAARAADRREAEDDLFLTAASLDASLGGYQELVRRRALERAAGVRPAQVVPFDLRRPAGLLLGILAVAVVAVLFLPSFDPFGIQAAADEREERQREKAVLAEQTEKRKKELEAERVEEEHAPPVDDLLDDFSKKMREVHRGRPPERNREELKRQQQRLGDLYRKTRDERLGEALDRARRNQQRQGGGKFEQAIRKAIAEGDGSDFQKQVAKLQETARQLAQAKDPGKRQQLARQLQQGLKQLQNAAAQQPGMQQLQQAAERAQKQLAMNQLQGFNPPGMQQLQQSLDLAGLEMQQLAQAVRDAQALENAMKLLQQARAMNQQGNLPNQQQLQQQLQQQQALQQLAQLYQQSQGNCPTCGSGTCQGGGQCPGGGPGAAPGQGGQGQGMGGPGRGRGGKAPEDPDFAAGWKKEKSPSATRAGKILMQWEAKESAPRGEARKEYVEAVRAVKEGVGEAILRDRVPAGYHGAIQQYFDELERDVAAPGDGDAVPRTDDPLGIP